MAIINSSSIVYNFGLKMHICSTLLNLSLITLPTLAVPGRNLTSLFSPLNPPSLPYPTGYTPTTCPPSTTNAWSNPPRRKPRSPSTLCKSIARLHFNHYAPDSIYPDPPLLLQAGVHYVIAFSSTIPVLGITVYEAAVGTTLYHRIAHPNFARTLRGTLTITLKRAAQVWVMLTFEEGYVERVSWGCLRWGRRGSWNWRLGLGGCEGGEHRMGGGVVMILALQKKKHNKDAIRDRPRTSPKTRLESAE